MHVKVYLEFPEQLVGIVRLLSVKSYDSEGKEVTDYQELIDNTEFHCEDNDYREEIRTYVSSKTGISPENIEIMK